MGDQWVAGEDVTAAGAPGPSFPAHAVTFITTCEMVRTVPPRGWWRGSWAAWGPAIVVDLGLPSLVWELERPTAGEPGMGGSPYVRCHGCACVAHGRPLATLDCWI